MVLQSIRTKNNWNKMHIFSIQIYIVNQRKTISHTSNFASLNKRKTPESIGFTGFFDGVVAKTCCQNN